MGDATGNVVHARMASLWESLWDKELDNITEYPYHVDGQDYRFLKMSDALRLAAPDVFNFGDSPSLLIRKEYEVLYHELSNAGGRFNRILIGQPGIGE